MATSGQPSNSSQRVARTAFTIKLVPPPGYPASLPSYHRWEVSSTVPASVRGAAATNAAFSHFIAAIKPSVLYKPSKL